MNKDQSIITTINLVNTEISQQGLAKSQKNTMQNYMYRGIDGLYDLLSPIFAKHGLVIIPSALEHHREVAGQTKSGSNTYAVVVKMQYEICHIHNDQTKIAVFYGEAMDTSDKATNKAKTAAYKYMAFELFNIPIDGADNDADNSSHEVKKTADTKERKEEQALIIAFNTKKQLVPAEHAATLTKLITNIGTVSVAKLAEWTNWLNSLQPVVNDMQPNADA
jgi:hypothetical protein